MASEEKHLAWIVGVLGIFHGLFVAGFPLPYSVGTGVLQIAAVGVMGFGARYLSVFWRRGIAWGLLAAGLGGFGLRVVVK
jgi:hypothetical protein